MSLSVCRKAKYHDEPSKRYDPYVSSQYVYVDTLEFHASENDNDLTVECFEEKENKEFLALP